MNVAPGLSAAALKALCWATYRRLDRRLRIYRTEQGRLHRELGLEASRPRPYDEETRAAVKSAAAGHGPGCAFAWTSGTTAEPKQICYPPERVRRVHRTYLLQAVLAWQHHRAGLPAFHFPVTQGQDGSLAGLLSGVKSAEVARRIFLPMALLPSDLTARLAARADHLAVQSLFLALARPTVVAMPNASTLTTLLDRVQVEWDEARASWSSLLPTGECRAIAGSLGRGAVLRLSHLIEAAKCTEPPSIADLLPRLRVVSCWQGGQVAPFLARLGQQLEGQGVVMHPMHSLSTETVATEVYPRVSLEGGLPVHPGVRYEFLPVEDCGPVKLLEPWELEEGEEYVMVVSDRYGLKRYDTRDVFSCHGVVGSVPLLAFRRRAGLGHSFTGEKLTAAQVELAIDSVRCALGLEATPMACFPTTGDDRLPGYLLIVCTGGGAGLDLDRIASMFDDALSEVNAEYRHKRDSGRLAPAGAMAAPFSTLRRRLSERWPGRLTSPSQFKLQPFYAETITEDDFA